MATNVTEKDKTLQEIIDWCEQLEFDGLRLANALLMQRDTTAYGVVKGQIDAYGKTADHCRSMLGYSGSMLSCLTYEDTDNSDPSDQPQVGDYGVAVRETADGQEEIPFHIEREERTGLPVALLNERLYAKPKDEDDAWDYAGEICGYQEDFIDRARDLLEVARKAVNE